MKKFFARLTQAFSPPVPQEVQETVPPPQVPTVSQAVLDELDAVHTAFSSPILLETSHDAILWEAGGRAALENLRDRLNKVQRHV